MTVQRDELYAALGSEIHAFAAKLFRDAEQQVRMQGGFFPTAGILDGAGRTGIVVSTSERHPASMEKEHVRLLYDIQRLVAEDDTITAVATIDWISMSGAGQTEQPAIKVHVHHRRGLAVVFYSPANRGSAGEWSFGDLIARVGGPLVVGWAITR